MGYGCEWVWYKNHPTSGQLSPARLIEGVLQLVYVVRIGT